MINTAHFNKWFDKNYEVTNNNKIKVIGKQRFLTETDIFANYEKVCDDCCLDKDFTPQDVKNELSRRYTNTNNAPAISCIDAIKDCLLQTKQFKISTSFSEIETTSDGQVFMPSDIDDMYNHIVRYRVNDGALSQYNVGDIKATLYDWQRESKMKAITNIYNKMKYDNEYEQFCTNYCKTVYDYFGIKERYEIFETLFKHWAWQVKRKMTGKPVVWHIWINFFGGTGIGKSYFISKLSDIMEEYSTRTTISKIFDDTKEVKRLTEKFILNFDELAINRDDASNEGALSTDEQSTLKSMLTGDKLDNRVYGTQNQARRRITFSCISSSNTHLYDVIFDETSMRRFFDFTCSSAIKTEDDYAKFNQWLDNSDKFWMGINENLETGYWNPQNEIGKEILAIQSKYYPTKSTLTYWNEYFEFVPTENKTDGDVQTRYSEYVSWCKLSGYKSKTLIGFINEIKKRFPELISKHGYPCFYTKDKEKEEKTHTIGGANTFMNRLTEGTTDINNTAF